MTAARHSPCPARRTAPRSRRRASAAGFGLVEMMVAVLIGIFIVGGVGAMFVNMKRSFVAQDGMGLLQDSERLALVMLTTTIEQAGYFPDPVNNAATSVMPADSGTYGTLAAGQSVVGTSGSNGASDSITTRYVTASSDGLMNCLGQVNTSGSNTLYVNTFTVSDAGELLCSTDGGTTTTALVSNVSSMAITYCVDTNGLGTAYRYLSASAVTSAGLWSRVRSARLVIAFANPYAGQSGQPATISWVQTINLMNQP